MKRRYLLTFMWMTISILAFGVTQPTDGKYYRIVNQNPDKNKVVITENTVSHGLNCVAYAGDKSFNQIWLYTGGKLKNAETSRSIASQSSTSNQFITSEQGNEITLTVTSDGHDLIRCGGMMHADGSNVVVCWNDAANESNHWDFVEVSVNAKELATAQEKYAKDQVTMAELKAIATKAKTYSPLMAEFFNDIACTELKSEYTAMSDAELKAAVAAKNLPEALQNIAVKVKNKWSDETSPKHSEMFRIHNYKCYARAGEGKYSIRSTQMSDLNNPTGIWTDNLQLLYVFVGNDIPAGASLRITGPTGNLARAWWDQGTELKKGLNIVYCDENMAYQWIMYTAPYSTTKPISDYPEIKIHIEGGEVLGYADVADLSEQDCNALYKDVLINANNVLKKKGASDADINFPVMGKYGILDFPVAVFNQIWATTPYNGYNYKTDYNIYKSMKFYDNVLMWQWSVMGFMRRVVDGDAVPDKSAENLTGGEDIYPTYINCRAPAMMVMNNGKNPYSSDGYTCMPGVGAVESSYNAERADFDTWCVGHESGHNNQGAINLESSTESSNNLLSNIITALHGYRMSRGGSFADNIKYSQNNTVFGKRDIGMTMRMYYNLYLYYHAAKKNTSFYPTLFKELRKDAMQLGTGTESWLKFYKKACDAAQEDLTEYFRLWGFFEPCDKVVFGDYTSYTVTLTQKQIDAAIESVKAKNYKENLQIIFIEDRIKPLNRTDFWATTATSDKKTKPCNEGYWITTQQRSDWYGDMGMFNDYIAENVKTASYTYTASGSTINLTGNGGVGIIVFNKAGIPAYYANKLSFNIPTSLAIEGYSIFAINADGSMIEVCNTAETGTPEQILLALKSTIEATATFTDLLDKSGKKVGFYSEDALKNLNNLITEANEAIKANKTNKYVELNRKFNAEMLRLQSTNAMTTIKANGLYTIYNKRENRYMTASSNDTSIKTITTNSSNTSRWAFVPAGEDGYYLENHNSKLFVDEISSASASTKKNAYKMAVVPVGDGSFYIEKYDDLNKSMNCDPSSHNVVEWSPDAGSQWFITLYSEMDEYTDEQLLKLANDVDDCIDHICTIETKKEKVALQVTDKSAPYYISTNQPNEESTPIKNLVDGNIFTNFYTNPNAKNAVHYIQVDFGNENKVQDFSFSYKTSTKRDAACPATIEVMAGTMSAIISSEKNVFENLPSGITKQQTYNSAMINLSKPYRYLRFRITETYDNDAGQNPYFGMAEFYIYTMNTVFTMSAGYENVDKSSIVNAQNKIENARETIKNGSSVMLNLDIYEALEKTYDTLNNTADGISDIQKDNDIVAKEGIYDISGRKLKEISTRGIYIINGKKVMVK